MSLARVTNETKGAPRNTPLRSPIMREKPGISSSNMDYLAPVYSDFTLSLRCEKRKHILLSNCILFY